MLIHRYKYLLQNQSGLTLVEVLVGMVLMLIIIVPAFSTLTAGINAFQSNMAQSQNITFARSSINAITDELRYATVTSLSISADKKTINYIVGTESRKIYIGSAKDAKTILIEHAGTITQKIAVNSIENIIFQQDGNKVNITLQLKDPSYTTSKELTITTISVVLQNM